MKTGWKQHILTKLFTNMDNVNLENLERKQTKSKRVRADCLTKYSDDRQWQIAQSKESQIIYNTAEHNSKTWNYNHSTDIRIFLQKKKIVFDSST